MVKFKSFEDVCKPSKGQTFDYQVTDYIYNKDTKLLSVAPQKRDIFEEINSYSNTSLDSILDKYSNLDQVNSSLVDFSADVKKRDNFDLSDIALAFEKAENYRQSRGLSDTLTYKQIYDIMLKDSLDLNNKLKGGEKNEKKTQTFEKSIEEVVHEDGSPNS